MVAQCGPGRRSGTCAKILTSGLRSLLRYLHLAGLIEIPLAQAVPRAAGWRLSSLPRPLEAEHVALLLLSCDQSTVVGRRDLAILALLARLGLRAGEVARLCLDDIDWRAGEVTIRGKGSSIECLPLPHEAGEALVSYLRHGRPQADFREVFVSMHAPLRPLSPTAVTHVVASACKRAGIEPVRRAPAAAHARERHVARRHAAGADRAGPQSRQRRDHRDIRQDRPRSAASARAAVAACGG